MQFQVASTILIYTNNLQFLNVLMLLFNYFFHLGGYKIISVSDENGALIYEEKSQGPETLRPWFIVPAKETYDNLEEICTMFENELLEAKEDLTVKIEKTLYPVAMDIANFFLDTKLINYVTGLHGAFCTMCDASEEEALNIDLIEDGKQATHSYFFDFLNFYFDLQVLS